MGSISADEGKQTGVSATLRAHGLHTQDHQRRNEGRHLTQAESAAAPVIDVRLTWIFRVPSAIQFGPSALRDIAATGKDLASRSFLKRAIWRNSVSTKIEKAYKAIESAMQDFKVSVDNQ